MTDTDNLYGWLNGSLFSDDNFTIADAIVVGNATRPPFKAPLIGKRALDYIELGVLISLFIVGAPINVHVFAKLRDDKYKRMQRRLLIMKKHLNISDLMILLIYTTFKICVLTMDHTWNAGRVLCKAMHFLNLMSFHISSNIIVCIALDRLLISLSSSSTFRVKIMLGMAWVAAFGAAAPQLAVWDVYTTKQKLKCSTYWQVQNGQNRTGRGIPATEFSFHIAHMITVFWLPACVITVCYSAILYKVWRAVRRPSTHRTSITEDTKCLYIASAPNGSDVTFVKQTRSSSAVSSISAKLGHLTDRNRSQSFRARAFKATAFLVIAYVLCWTPYNLMSVLIMNNYADKAKVQALALVTRFLQHFIIFNSVINPFLYTGISSTKRDIGCHEQSCIN